MTAWGGKSPLTHEPLLTEKRLPALQRTTLMQDLDRIAAVLNGIPATA
jgi:hypothetical protein